MAADNWSAGVGRGEVGSDDVKYYEPEPRERKVQLNLRVEESLRRGLDSLVQLWKVYAKARGDDPADVDLTFVIRRLLLVGIQGAFGEVLAEANLDAMPVSDAEWARFEKSLEKMVRDRG